MSIIIMNPNQRTDSETGQTVPNCETNESHCNYVWEKFILPSKYKKLYIVAHSYGGKCIANIQKKFENDFYSRVAKIVFTDCKTLVEK